MIQTTMTSLANFGFVRMSVVSFLVNVYFIVLGCKFSSSPCVFRIALTNGSGLDPMRTFARLWPQRDSLRTLVRNSLLSIPQSAPVAKYNECCASCHSYLLTSLVADKS